MLLFSFNIKKIQNIDLKTFHFLHHAIYFKKVILKKVNTLLFFSVADLLLLLKVCQVLEQLAVSYTGID